MCERVRQAARWRLGRAIAAAVPFAFGASCYEVPPRIPAGYGPLARNGGPPRAIYFPEPFHPANRWFQRSFAARDAAGRIASAPADAPFSLLEDPAPLDRAEIAALLEALVEEHPPDGGDPVSRLVLHADLLEQAAYWERQGDAEALARAHTHAARRIGWNPPGHRLELLPPPLRDGEWVRVETPPSLSRRLAAGDSALYVHRHAAGAGSARRERTALLFLRLVEEAGELRTASPARECWLLEATSGGVEPRVFRFDRSRWLQGEDPWREVAPAETIAIEDLSTPEQDILEGSMRPLCLSCHAAPDPPRSAPAEG